MSGQRTLLHDGDEFVLHYRAGTAKYILVTFVGMNHESQASHDYLLSPFAERYDIPCLGVTCKNRNVYRHPEIEEVIEAIREVVRRYQVVVAVGFSLGGYAAMKFSRRIGATHVLAVAPAFSLDPAELELETAHNRSEIETNLAAFTVDPRYGLQGMAIRPGEVCGRVAVIHNPLSPIDAHHVNLLRRVIDPEAMPLPQDGHDIFAAFHRPETMWTVIELLRFAGPADLAREFRMIRRSNPHCIVPILRRALNRHPMLVHRALRSEAIAISKQLGGLNRGQISLETAYQLAENGHQAAAFGRIEAMIRDKLGRPVAIAANQGDGSTSSLETGRFYLLLSMHGSFLAAEIATGRLTATWDPFSTDGLTPVFASLSDGMVVLRTMSGAGQAGDPLPVADGLARFELVAIGGRITLRTPAGFLFLTQRDSVEYPSAEINTWEQLLPIAVDSPASLIQRRGTEWLEASSRRVFENNNTPAAARPMVGPWGRLMRIAGRGR